MKTQSLLLKTLNQIFIFIYSFHSNLLQEIKNLIDVIEMFLEIEGVTDKEIPHVTETDQGQEETREKNLYLLVK